MQRLARIENGAVVEIVEIGDDYTVAECFHPSLIFISAPPEVTAGWRYDDETFLPPISVSDDPAIPPEISRPQAALQMRAMSLIDDDEMVAMAATGTPPAMVGALIAALPTGDQAIAKVHFSRYTYARGNGVLVSMMAAAGYAPEEVDEFFRAAAAL